MDRLAWAGNTGTPSGGDHCGVMPSGTTISTSQQSYSYDALDRLISGPAGTETYGTTPVHGANTLSTVPNQYASYDAMGNMTCRNVDTTVGSTQSCDASQTGALMSYDNEGRLSSWTAPGVSTSTPGDQFLYDNSGIRVLQRVNNGTGNPTDTISFSGVTDVTINGSQTSTTKYYTACGQKVALRTDGVVSYLLPDTLGSVSLTLYADGSTESVQLYTPYGGVRYSNGSTPTAYGFTGQRFDSLTGLMYYVARYYDPISGRFTSADNVETNASGQDPYGYVKGNPETNTDPTGHGICPMFVASGCGGNPAPPSPPNASSPPLGTGNTGSDGGGNSGGNSGVCLFELGCSDGSTSSGSSGYPANAPSAPSAPVSCEGGCQLALWLLIVGFNYFLPVSIAADPEIAALELEENQNAAEAESEEGENVSWTESTIKDTLQGVGAKMSDADNLKLDYDENRLYLGHYGGTGTIIGGKDIPSFHPGESYLDTLAEDNGGSTLANLKNPTIDDITPHIEKADDIVFNIGRNGITPGSLTEQEFLFVINNDQILQRTTFVFGETY